jgi:predicted acylesterase/phospholipase RssA
MEHYEYDDEVLFVGQGAGFMAVECDVGIYRAFEEFGVIPGRVLSSSGSTLFASLYYSVETTKWFDALMSSTSPGDFIDFNLAATIQTMLSSGTFMIDNAPVKKILTDNMTGNASLRVTTSVTRNTDWTTHMRHVTPGWATAATSIPFVFKPVKIGDHLWSDGGVLNNLPAPSIEEAEKYNHIFVFAAPRFKVLEGSFILFQLINLLQAVMEREVEQLKETGFFDLPNVTLIQPPDSLGGSLLGWSPEFKLRDSVYAQTKELLKNVKL